MLTQIIRGETELPVKYHGKVKFIIFECNNCHKEFNKPVSYYRKQLKTRENACCFCSPECRTAYLKQKLQNMRSQVQGQGTEASEKQPEQQKSGFISSILNIITGDK